jgi:hypothetical protein
MEDIQPLRYFLNEIQGQPELIYTGQAADAYNRGKEKVQAIHPVNKQQLLWQQHLLKQLENLQDLIREYERQIADATEYLAAVTETEKKHLKAAFYQIIKTEQEVQLLLQQVG